MHSMGHIQPCLFDASRQDIRKLAKQCQTCYAYNRRRPHPVQLHFTRFSFSMNVILGYCGYYVTSINTSMSWCRDHCLNYRYFVMPDGVGFPFHFLVPCIHQHTCSFNGTVLELLQEHNSTNWDVSSDNKYRMLSMRSYEMLHFISSCL